MKESEKLWAGVVGQASLASLNWKLAEAYLLDVEIALKETIKQLENAGRSIQEIKNHSK